MELFYYKRIEHEDGVSETTFFVHPYVLAAAALFIAIIALII